MIRTHNCGELNAGDRAKETVLAGWVASRRDHGDIIFIDLRDKHGITQIVFDPGKNKTAHEKAHSVRNEYCLRVWGTVRERSPETVNPKISTGEIEIEVKDIEVLSSAETLPFEIKDDNAVNEEARLKYRYLDLRRPVMQEKLMMRHRVYKAINDFMDARGFVFVETPMLTKSTPEGARDYLVPSRIQQGCFYALPQSPQLFKQLLMVAGLEKYYQIVRCFRDEDLRADRQPEFTQLDIEVSFMDQDDLFGVCEDMFKRIFKEAAGIDVKTPFPRMRYEEAVTRYGSDKPDTRFGVLLHDLTGIAANCAFNVFRNVAAQGGEVRGLCAPGYGGISRKEIDELTAFAAEYGAAGLAYFKVEENGIASPIAKFFSEAETRAVREITGARPGDMIFMVAASSDITRAALGALRLKIGREKKLIDENRFDLHWVVDFPLFKFNKEENRWVSEHHPFTRYNDADEAFMEKKEYGKVRSLSYDLVLNGSEIGSGSMRIYRRDVQRKIFEILGLTPEECEKKFGFLLEAFNYGPPPHAGIAFGIDRLLTMMTGDVSIREVIAFPKTQKGICPLTEAPSQVDDAQLRDLGIKLRKPSV